MQEYVKATTNGEIFYIQSDADDLNTDNNVPIGPSIEWTSLSSIEKNAYEQWKRLITVITNDIGKTIYTIQRDVTPDTVELSLTMAYSSKLKAWIINASGEISIKLRLTWGAVRNGK